QHPCPQSSGDHTPPFGTEPPEAHLPFPGPRFSPDRRGRQRRDETLRLKFFFENGLRMPCRSPKFNPLAFMRPDARIGDVIRRPVESLESRRAASHFLS